MIHSKDCSYFKPVTGNAASSAEDLALIRAAAKAGGAVGLRYFRNNPEAWLKKGGSPVSEADMAVDKCLKDILLTARPDYGWISEETADERSAAHYKRYFVVDPIDGTRGFLHGDPRWCVSVAVTEGGRPTAGVLDCPALPQPEHWTGICGGEALVNGKQAGAAELRPSEVLAKKTGRLLISARTNADKQRLPQAFAQQVEWAEHIPSLAYRLALLARGELDAVFIRANSHDWDIAAVDVILQNCGAALVTDSGHNIVYGKGNFTHGFLLAARHDTLQRILKIIVPLAKSR